MNSKAFAKKELPKGTLVVLFFEADFDEGTVSLAAAHILQNGGTQAQIDECKTQAEIIALAGNHFGWGAGEGSYQAM